MAQPTERLQRPGALLRLDPATGTLKERRYQVRIVAGPDVGETREVVGTMVLGTHPDAGLTLTDTTVSRYHVELTARPEGVRVRDLESTNGTYLGAARIAEVIVEDLATITVGKTTLQVGMAEADLGRPSEQATFGAAVGASHAMKQLFGIMEKVAPSDSTVLLLGETGTGKEVMARALHAKSRRAGRPFVVVDCGAVAPTLIESELFGHIRGAFTGAVSDRNGAFLEADGGTIFLDELGELPLELQPKLLRVLEAGTVRRVGEDKPRRVDVRVVAATHRELEAEIAAGRFRQDLYYRLAVVPVTVPPLRARVDDIPMLARHFVKEMGRGDFALPSGLLERFAEYRWPGNVRELRNLVERALAGADVEPLSMEGNGPSARRPSPPPESITGMPFKEAKEKLVESFTREYLAALLEKCGGNISKMAREAGIARNYVHRLVTKYGLKAQDER
jgi:two-component system, NtrC family, response regulator GlrR